MLTESQVKFSSTQNIPGVSQQRKRLKKQEIVPYRSVQHYLGLHKPKIPKLIDYLHLILSQTRHCSCRDKSFSEKLIYIPQCSPPRWKLASYKPLLDLTWNI